MTAPDRIPLDPRLYENFALCGEALTPEQASPEQNSDHRIKLSTPLFQRLSMETVNLCKLTQFRVGTACMIDILHESKLHPIEEQNRNYKAASTAY